LLQTASVLFQAGRNAVQVQRWLGHHKASFTLDTYIHLLDDGLGEALDTHLNRGYMNCSTSVGLPALSAT
jgi:integrase